MALSDQQTRVVQLIAAGHSYDQILSATPGLSYLDIFDAAQTALDQLATPAYSVKEVRKELPNAYSPWAGEEEAELERRALAGESTEEIAIGLGRSVGAVRSRTVRIFLDRATRDISTP